MKKRLLYSIMTIGGFVGLLASVLQILEKLQLAAHAHQALVCDLNSVFSCSNVLNAWQSSVFGFPNSILCLIFFTMFTVLGLVGWSGGSIPRRLRLAAHGIAVFLLGFAVWFLTQSIYVIGSLCILCLFCFAGLLLVNGAWLRLNMADLPLGKRANSVLARLAARGADLFIWMLLALSLLFAVLLHFR